MINSSNLRRILIFIYICSSFFEFAFKTPLGGSLLKYIVVVASVLLILESLFTKKKILISDIAVCVVIWEAANCLSLLWSRDVQTGGYLCKTIFFSVVLIVLIDNTQWRNEDKSRLLFFYSFFGVLFALIVVIGSTTYHGADVRYSITLFGYETDPNSTGAFVAEVCVILIDSIVKRRRMIFSCIGLGVSVFALFMVASRGAFLAVICAGLAYVVFFLIENKKKPVRIILTVFLFTTILYVLLSIIKSNVDIRLINRLVQKDSYEDGSGRTKLWGIAFENFLENPLLGRGIGSFLKPLSHNGFHNMYIAVFSDVSIFSFVPFISMIVICYMRSIINRNWMMVSVLICMSITVFFLDAYSHKFFWNPIYLCTLMFPQHTECYDKYDISETSYEKSSIK